MTKFRPCIDLHDGKVKQIVGSSLNDSGVGLKTNFETDRSPAWFAELYKKDNIKGGHVIMLGKGNVDAAKAALSAYPGGLQVGGGITADNAKEYIDAGASHVIVTSWIFPEGKFDISRLERLVEVVGKEHLVLDLRLARYCDEFLVHAADVEGKQQGMDDDLIRFLAAHSPIPATYAGGAKTLEDLKHVKDISGGKVDLTIGSALDLFGGKGVKYDDCVKFNKG